MDVDDDVIGFSATFGVAVEQKAFGFVLVGCVDVTVMVDADRTDFGVSEFFDDD